MNTYVCVCVCAYIYMANIKFTYWLLNNFYESIALGVQACHIYSGHTDLQSYFTTSNAEVGGVFLENYSWFFLYFL